MVASAAPVLTSPSAEEEEGGEVTEAVPVLVSATAAVETALVDVDVDAEMSSIEGQRATTSPQGSMITVPP
jgi:hypothetical protein